MACNGDEAQQVEYGEGEAYLTDYVEQSAEYQELVGLGLDAQVAKELDDFFQTGEHLSLLLVIFSRANSGLYVC